MRLLFALLCHLALGRAQIKVEKDASFSIIGTGGFRLDSGTYMIHRGDKTYLTTDGSLKVDFIGIDAGHDSNGHYEEFSYNFNTADKDVSMMAFIRTYHARQFAVFRQHFYPGFSGLSVGDSDKVSTSFPSVKVPEKSEAQFINPCKHMAGWYTRKDNWNQDHVKDMCGGIKGGPIFVYDKTNLTLNHAGQVFAISSFTKHTSWTMEASTKLNELWFGLPGLVKSLPDSGYDMETIISYGDVGFYESIQKWGLELRTKHQKSLKRRESDDTVNYLGYWTDNGAFYYYNTEPNKTYEETMLDVYNEIRHGDENLPFRSWNYDSWWYPKCPNDAVLTWTAMPEIFPNGMESVYQKTSLPVVAHNRWWCNETTYSDRNGGSYKFIIDDSVGTAVPQDDRFWEDLFKNASAWGLEVYLQDWLDVETNHMSIFEEDLEVERNWLLQMGAGAARNDINILYCMSYSRHMMQSVEIQNVVSIRASDDYQPGNHQWDIGLTDIWTWAIGLAPFKDTFWTTKEQPGYANHGKPVNKTEWHPELESAMATLSMGIVGISDKIGYTNEKLVAKSIMADGLILKPSRPLAVPDYILWDKNATMDADDNQSNETAEFETYSEVSGTRFGIILAYNSGNTSISSNWKPKHLGNYQFSKNNKNDEIHATDYMTTFTSTYETGTEIDHVKWHHNRPLTQPPNNYGNHTGQILIGVYMSPIWKLGGNEVSFVGEIDKWTYVSPNRFPSIDLSSDRVYIDIIGVPNETVGLRFTVQAPDAKEPQIVDHACNIPQSTRTQLIMVLKDEDKGIPKIYCQDA